jgi:hypothetical protein
VQHQAVVNRPVADRLPQTACLHLLSIFLHEKIPVLFVPFSDFMGGALPGSA